MQSNTYEAFMSPRTVAVVGASNDPDKAAGKVQKYLRRYGYEGQVFPVNPSRAEVQGVPAFPSVSDIPTGVDLAVLVTPAKACLAAVRDCVAMSVPSVIVISAGFGEVGPEGQQLQDEIAAATRGTPTRVLGPNCLGIVRSATRLTATINTGLEQDAVELRAGSVALLSQSGAVGSFIFNTAQSMGVPLGAMVTTGNEMDVTFSEMLLALVEDPEIRGVMGYIEGIRDGDVFIQALRRARQLGKPLGLMKVGRSPQGQAAITSHTGALAGEKVVYEDLLAQYDVAQLDGIEAMLDWGVMIDRCRPPRSGRISVATTSGGVGIMVADYAADEGLELATWDAAERSRLAEVLPPYASLTNPIDMTGAGGYPGVVREVGGLMVDHPDTDVALIVLGNLEAREERLIADLVDLHASTDVPVIVVWIGGSGRPLRALTEAGVPTFPDPARAMRALGALTRAELTPVPAPAPTDGQEQALRRAVEVRATVDGARRAGRRELDEVAAKGVLADYGLPVVDEWVVADAEGAADAADAAGYPVVLKILHEGLAHKSEVGGVELGLEDADAVRAAAAAMDERLPAGVRATRRFLVQRMAQSGLEMLLGVRRDPTFGPMVVVGMGGTWTEALNDVRLLAPPFSDGEVRRAIDGLRMSQLLGPFRGDAPRDIDALVRAVQGLATLAVDLDEMIEEVDVNPLILGAEGSDTTAVVDALVVLSDEPGGEPRRDRGSAPKAEIAS